MAAQRRKPAAETPRPLTPDPDPDPEPTHPQHPEPAHTPTAEYHSSDDEREATELLSADAQRLVEAARAQHARPRRFEALRRWWRQSVRISVPHVACRDHLANERTFLGYLRTSLMLSMVGTFIAQFYRLHVTPAPDAVFGYFVVSKPLAAVFQCAALGVVVLGSVRFWRQQGAMARGRVFGGGWELGAIGVGVLLLLLTLFAVHVALGVLRD